MSDTVRLEEDLQASVPEISLALSRAGVTGVQKAVRIRRGGVLVGEHERCWARQQTITDSEHRVAADDVLARSDVPRRGTHVPAGHDRADLPRAPVALRVGRR